MIWNTSTQIVLALSDFKVLTWGALHKLMDFNTILSQMYIIHMNCKKVTKRIYEGINILQTLMLSEFRNDLLIPRSFNDWMLTIYNCLINWNSDRYPLSTRGLGSSELSDYQSCRSSFPGWVHPQDLINDCINNLLYLCL